MSALYTLTAADGTLLFCYKQKRMEEGYRDSVHNYDEMKYVRLLRGAGIWRIGDTDYAVKAGDVLLLSRTDIRQVKHITDAPLIIEQADFLPAFLTPLQQTADFFVRRPEGFTNLLPPNEEISRLLDELIEEIREERPYKEQALHSRLSLLVIATARLLSVPQGASYEEKGQDTVRAAMGYIRAHFAEELSLEDTARRFFLSPAYFSRLFRRHSGLSFQDYLAHVRVSEVLSLMDSRPINILDAALSCGFASSSGFYRTFRRVTGTTPKHFKKR